jgi:hypothetical protein
MRDELFRELKQELFAEMRSELLRSQQKITVVHQENAMFRKRIEELESVSVCASTPASPVSMPLDQPAGILDSHLLDPVVFLTQMGNFTEDEARRAFSQSNNNAHVAADMLLSCPPVPSARIRFEESQYKSPTSRGRGRGGITPQSFRSSLSPLNPAPIQQSVPSSAASSVNVDHLASTFGKLTDVIGNLGTLLTDNMGRIAKSTRDSTRD